MNENLTMLDIAIKQGYGYATKMEQIYATELRGISKHAVIKNAYQDGFLAGFTYKLTGDKDGNTLQGREDN